MCTKDAGAGWRNIRWDIKVYVWVETVGLFLLCFYRVPVALGKSQGRACIPLILHMLLTSRKTTVSLCVCENQDMSCHCAGPLSNYLTIQTAQRVYEIWHSLPSAIFCVFNVCVSNAHMYFVCTCLLYIYNYVQVVVRIWRSVQW